MNKRKYFSSTLQEYNFPQVQAQSYLYIYKHRFPQIIVRFPYPSKSVTGYRLYYAQIFYYPFYEEADFEFQHKSGNIPKRLPKVQKLCVDFQGEIILSLQISIFNHYFRQQVLNHLKQQKQDQGPPVIKRYHTYNKKKSQTYSLHLEPINNSLKQYEIADSTAKTQEASEMFQVLLKQWLNEQEISSMFLLEEKHIKTFQSFDHGFMRLEILKTSDKTLKAPFHQYMKYKNWTQEEIKQYFLANTNKIYYFEFQSSVLSTSNQDYNDVQKLGLVVPQPMTINQFFYQILLMIFGQFQAVEKQKQDKRKRQQERQKMKQALLQNLRQMGVQAQMPDLNYFQADLLEQVQNQDSLDQKLFEIFDQNRQNKNKSKHISPIKDQPSHKEHIKAFNNHNQSYFEQSPRRRLSTKISDMRQQQQTEQQITNRLRTTTLNKIKIARSFTSELLEKDFQQKPKRRFISREQYLKILEFNQRLMSKKQEKQKKKYEEQDKFYQSPRKKKEELVYVGPQNNSMTKSQKKSSLPNQSTNQFKFDFFANHQEILLIQEQKIKQPTKYSWQEDDEFLSYEHYQDSR